LRILQPDKCEGESALSNPGGHDWEEDEEPMSLGKETVPYKIN
jgi:hypothetical protein